MKTARFICLAFLVLLGAVLGGAGAANRTPILSPAHTDPPAPVTPNTGAPVVEPPTLGQIPLTPLHKRIHALIAQERSEASDLQKRIFQATDDETSVALQRELEALKHRTQLSLLRIQADYAREQGRLEQAARIEAALESLRNPPPARLRPEGPAGPEKSAGSGR